MISPEQGVGIEFEHNERRCITLPRTGIFDLNIQANIHTYIGSVWYAKHFYASLHFNNLNCKIIGDISDATFISNTQPKESRFKRIDVLYPAPANVYGDRFGVKYLEIKKGCPTTRFSSIEECIKAIELSFEDNFGGEPWILTDDNYDSWDEKKISLIKEYSGDAKWEK